MWFVMYGARRKTSLTPIFSRLTSTLLPEAEKYLVAAREGNCQSTTVRGVAGLVSEMKTNPFSLSFWFGAKQQAAFMQRLQARAHEWHLMLCTTHPTTTTRAHTHTYKQLNRQVK